MRLTLTRQFHSRYSFDLKMWLGGFTIHILPELVYYKINQNYSITVSWLCWGLILQLSPYYDKGTFKFECE